jgi:hypothetical protein
VPQFGSGRDPRLRAWLEHFRSRREHGIPPEGARSPLWHGLTSTLQILRRPRDEGSIHLSISLVPRLDWSIGPSIGRIWKATETVDGGHQNLRSAHGRRPWPKFPWSSCRPQWGGADARRHAPLRRVARVRLGTAHCARAALVGAPHGSRGAAGRDRREFWSRLLSQDIGRLAAARVAAVGWLPPRRVRQHHR